MKRPSKFRQESLPKRLKRDDESPQAYGWRLYEENAWDAILTYFEPRLAENSGDEVSNFFAGSAHRMKGNSDRAKELYGKTISTGGSLMHQAHFGLALLLADEAPAEAIKHYKLAIALKPNFEKALNNLGTLLAGDSPEEAKKYYNLAIEAKPDYAQALFNMGSILATDSPEEAKKYFKLATEADSNDPDTYYNVGVLFIREGHFSQAETQFRVAYKLKPSQYFDALHYALEAQDKTNDLKVLFEEELTRHFCPLKLHKYDTLLQVHFPKTWEKLERPLEVFTQAEPTDVFAAWADLTPWHRQKFPATARHLEAAAQAHLFVLQSQNTVFNEMTVKVIHSFLYSL